MTLAIISGNGDLPKMIIEQCKREQKSFIIITIKGQEISQTLLPYPKHQIKIGHITKALEILSKNNITEITFAGGIKKPTFSEISVDKDGAILLAKITSAKIFGDNNTLDVIVKFFKKKGFKIKPITEILDNIMLKKGIISSKKPTKEDLDNIKIGQELIKKISSFDVGQSVVVQQKQVIAIEAIEGTDEMINRCKNIKFKNQQGPILIKTSKDKQNKNIDLPSLGSKTIKNLHNAGFSGLAIESKNSIIIDKKSVLELIEKYNMFLVGI